MTSEEQKQMVRETVNDVFDKVEKEIGFCGCYEGDIHNSYPKAKAKAIELIRNLTYPNGQPMLAILAEEQSLPPIPHRDHVTDQRRIVALALQDMLNDGWRKTL